MNLLDAMQSKVLDLLQPLVSETAQFGVKTITTQTFDAAADIDDLLELFGGRMPAAFLSVPKVTYDTNPSNLRIIDPVLSYGLLIGLYDRRSADVRQGYAMEMHDAFLRTVALRTVSRNGVPCSGIDYVRPETWEFYEDNTGEMSLSAFLLSFSIKIRNWQINTPA